MLRARLIYGVVCAAIILAGLTWRLVPLGLPQFWWKYGGSLLWAAMVYFGLRLLKPQAPITTALGLALMIATCVEFSRLIEWPWLDAFRATAAGILTIGKIFALTNLIAYGLGIGTAFLIDAACKSSSPKA